METIQVKTATPKKSPLLRNREFMLIYLSSFFTSMAFSAYLMAESWYIVDHLKLGTFLGVVMMLTAVPRLLFMIIGGVMADRHSSTKIMIVSLLIRIFLLIGMVALFLTEGLNIWLLMMFALAFGVLDAYFWPASTSIVPAIVEKESLTRANAMMRTAYHVSMILGPFLAAAVLAVASYDVLFETVALLLGVSSILIYFVKDVRGRARGRTESMFAQLKEGLLYIKNTKLIFVFVVVFIVWNFLFVGPVGVATPLIVHDVLHGDALVLSYMDGAWAVGLLSGSIITGILNMRKKRGILTLGLLFSQGLLIVWFSQMSMVWEGMLIVLLMGLATSMVNIPIYSFVQETTDKDKIGRVMGIFTMASNGLVPLSFALVSIILGYGVWISSMLLLCGILLMLFCVIAFFKVKGIRVVD